MEVEGYYINERNFKTYGVLGYCKIKLGERWLDGVVYLRGGEIFCRAKEDFLRNFEQKTSLKIVLPSRGRNNY